MPLALVYGSRICEVADQPFPVAAPLRWIDVPDGTTAEYTLVDGVATAPEPPPPAIPKQPTPREWLERLPGDKQAAISAAAVQNPAILLWLLKAAGTTTIDVSLDETKQGVGALALAGVLTSDDAAILLAP